VDHPGSDWKIGTIGFAYDQWAGVFFPPGLRTPSRLRYYASQFDFIELDTTFYALPPADRVIKWKNAVPGDFQFSLKVPSVITHEIVSSKLSSELVGATWKGFREMVQLLGTERCISFFQMPPGFTIKQWRYLEDFLGEEELVSRTAVEFRDDSLVHPDVVGFLTSKNIAWVGADLAPIGEAGLVPTDPRASYRPLAYHRTADWAYLRLCGRHAQYESDSVELADATPRIRWWVEQLKETTGLGLPVVAACGNSFAGHGPATCGRLMDVVGIKQKQPMQDRLFEFDEVLD